MTISRRCWRPWGSTTSRRGRGTKRSSSPWERRWTAWKLLLRPDARTLALLPWRPAAETLAERRAAIRALLCIDGDSLTLAAVNRAIQGCGIRAQVRETGVGTVEVWFPGQQGVPAQFERIRRILLDLLPCHLAVTFCFRYLSWEEFEGRSPSWAAVEAAGTTWEELELSSTRTDSE